MRGNTRRTTGKEEYKQVCSRRNTNSASQDSPPAPPHYSARWLPFSAATMALIAPPSAPDAPSSDEKGAIC